MNFRKKAIELYNQGKSIEEISKNIGFNIEENTVKNWANEEKNKEFKMLIFKLDKKQRKEKDYNKRNATEFKRTIRKNIRNNTK